MGLEHLPSLCEDLLVLLPVEISLLLLLILLITVFQSSAWVVLSSHH
jgi:hypothetical protein